MSDLNQETIRWIEAVLSNDENASPEELVQHFMSEGGLSEQAAREWVAKRNEYMGWKDA